MCRVGNWLPPRPDSCEVEPPYRWQLPESWRTGLGSGSLGASGLSAKKPEYH